MQFVGAVLQGSHPHSVRGSTGVTRYRVTLRSNEEHIVEADTVVNVTGFVRFMRHDPAGPQLVRQMRASLIDDITALEGD